MFDHHPLCAVLDLRLAGEPAALGDATLSVERRAGAEGGAAPEVRLQGDVDFFTWMRLSATGRFAFDELSATETCAAFDPGRPLRLELRLNASGRAAAPGPVTGPDIAAALIGAPPGAPLRSLEGWDVVAITQRLGPRIRGGFSVRGDRSLAAPTGDGGLSYG